MRRFFRESQWDGCVRRMRDLYVQIQLLHGTMRWCALPVGRTCPFTEAHPVRRPGGGTSATPKVAEAGAVLLRPRGKAAGGMVERSASEHTMADVTR